MTRVGINYTIVSMKLLSGLSEIRLDNIQSCTMLYSDLNVFFSKSMAFVEASLLYFNKYVISVKSICRIKKNQFFEMLEKNNIRIISDLTTESD